MKMSIPKRGEVQAAFWTLRKRRDGVLKATNESAARRVRLIPGTPYSIHDWRNPLPTCNQSSPAYLSAGTSLGRICTTRLRETRASGGPSPGRPHLLPRMPGLPHAHRVLREPGRALGNAISFASRIPDEWRTATGGRLVVDGVSRPWFWSGTRLPKCPANQSCLRLRQRLSSHSSCQRGRFSSHPEVTRWLAQRVPVGVCHPSGGRVTP